MDNSGDPRKKLLVRRALHEEHLVVPGSVVHSFEPAPAGGYYQAHAQPLSCRDEHSRPLARPRQPKPAKSGAGPRSRKRSRSGGSSLASSSSGGNQKPVCFTRSGQSRGLGTSVGEKGKRTGVSWPLPSRSSLGSPGRAGKPRSSRQRLRVPRLGATMSRSTAKVARLSGPRSRTPSSGCEKSPVGTSMGTKRQRTAGAPSASASVGPASALG